MTQPTLAGAPATLTEAMTVIDRLRRQLAESDADHRAMDALATQLMNQRAVVLVAIHIADADDVTDWQRGYRACAENVEAIYAERCPSCPEPLDGPHGPDCVVTKLKAEFDAIPMVDVDQSYHRLLTSATADRDVINAAKHFRRLLETATHRGNLDGPAEDAEADFIHAVDAHNALDIAESPHPFMEMPAYIWHCRGCKALWTRRHDDRGQFWWEKIR